MCQTVQNVFICCNATHTLNCMKMVFLALAFLISTMYVQWVGILNKHIFEACELAQAQKKLILIVITPFMILFNLRTCTCEEPQGT